MNTFTLDRKLALKNCIQEAEKRGGACLSKKYKNALTPMRWRCQSLHVWDAVWSKIKAGQWCRICSTKKVADKSRHSISLMQTYARRHKGLCVSKKYIDNGTYLVWQCERGHNFKKTPNLVQQGHWCGKCTKDDRFNKAWEKYFTLAKIYVKKRKGLIKQASPAGGMSIKILCCKGHEWVVDMTALLYYESWCGTCLGHNKTIQDLKDLAKERGGKSLAPNYKNSKTNVLWECKFGHQFLASLSNVGKGRWCPTCGRMKSSVLATKKRAIQKGGFCLSEIYEGPNYHHRIAQFQCHKGHVWTMSASDLTKGYWCPECLRHKLKSK